MDIVLSAFSDVVLSLVQMDLFVWLVAAGLLVGMTGLTIKIIKGR